MCESEENITKMIIAFLIWVMNFCSPGVQRYLNVDTNDGSKNLGIDRQRSE